MAVFNGSGLDGFDFRDFNFADLIAPLEFFHFLDNVNEVATSADLPGLPGTFAYSDLVEVWTGSPDLDLATAVVSITGENVTWDASGGDPLIIDANDVVTGGSVTGLYAAADLSTINEQWLYLVGFSVSALDFYAAVQTMDNTDDLALLQQMLAGDDTIYGSDGSDFFFGGAGKDQIQGGAGNDWLNGDAENDSLYGGSSSDLLEGGGGADFLDGGDGIDVVSYNLSTSGVVVSLLAPGTNTGDAAGDVYIGIENIYGTAFNDTITGNNDGNTLVGSEGSDQVFGQDGDDSLWGGTGEDVLFGNIGNDTLFGEDGNDVLAGGAGADVLNGMAGTRDRVQYTDSTAGLRVDLQVATTNTGIAAGDTFVGVEDVYGSFHGDSLLGDTGANILWGEGGNDSYLDGRVGNDTIYGGTGNDVMIGGWGADLLDGGSGTRDRVQYSDSAVGLRVDIQVTTFNTGIAVGDVFVGVEDIYGSFHGDTLLGDSGANIIWGEAGSDAWLDGRIGNDTVYGGAGNDVLIGGAGADLLDGGAGTRDRVQYTDSALGLRADLQVTTFNTGVAMGDTYVGIEDIFGGFQGDTLLGDGGGNMIWGSAGNDLIDGRLGNDTLIGGAGNDTLTGGSGADVFLFETALGATNVDSVSGYSVADDTIQLENAIFTALAATGALAGTAFTTGAAATTAAHRIIYNSANGQLLYDADGNGAGAAVHFATLATGLAIVADEFVVV